MITLITGIVESTLLNLDYGDRDSLGVFQQRPSQGWGTPEQVKNVTYATNKFLDVLLQQTDWKTGQYGELAQDVQRSAFPDRYQEYVPEAEAIYARLSGTTVADASLFEECDNTDDRIEQAVLAALGMIGNPYTWASDKPYDGVGFLQEAFEAGDITLPGSIDELATYEGDEATGIESRFIPSSEFTSGGKHLARGDILLMSDGRDNTLANARSAGVFTGTSPGGFTIASQNVLGSTHTKGRGDEARGVNRIKTAIALIRTNGFSVVGLQELQLDQRSVLLERLPGYAIYPDPPHYGRKYGYPGPHSDNSIIWDTNQLSFVRGGKLPMPYTHGKIPRNIPVVLLKSNTTDEEFFVVNTHDPARAEHVFLRWLAEIGMRVAWMNLWQKASQSFSQEISTLVSR